MTGELRGITWNHSRGYVSVVATAQRYMEMHPEIKISWEKRSLQAFADHPIDVLAQQYDLLVYRSSMGRFCCLARYSC